MNFIEYSNIKSGKPQLIDLIDMNNIRKKKIKIHDQPTIMDNFNNSIKNYIYIFLKQNYIIISIIILIIILLIIRFIYYQASKKKNINNINDFNIIKSNTKIISKSRSITRSRTKTKSIISNDIIDTDDNLIIDTYNTKNSNNYFPF